MESKKSRLGSVITIDSAFRDSYIQTRHKNLRCFPICSRVHMDKSFCGTPIEISVHRTDLEISQILLFGEFHGVKRERTFKKGDTCTTEQVDIDKFMLGQYAFSKSDGIRFVINPNRKWYCADKSKDSELRCLTVYLCINNQVEDIADSPGFHIVPIWRKPNRAEGEEEEEEEETDDSRQNSTFTESSVPNTTSTDSLENSIKSRNDFSTLVFHPPFNTFDSMNAFHNALSSTTNHNGTSSKTNEKSENYSPEGLRPSNATPPSYLNSKMQLNGNFLHTVPSPAPNTVTTAINGKKDPSYSNNFSQGYDGGKTFPLPSASTNSSYLMSHPVGFHPAPTRSLPPNFESLRRYPSEQPTSSFQPAPSPSLPLSSNFLGTISATSVREPPRFPSLPYGLDPLFIFKPLPLPQQFTNGITNDQEKQKLLTREVDPKMSSN